MDILETVKANQEKMADDISKIKEAMYNPDAGIYARLRIVEEQRRNSNRMVWFLFTMLVGSAGALISSSLLN
mgnify:FL=1